MTSAAAQPLHAQIRNSVLRQIDDGTLRPGDRLPSESEIMRQYSVSRGTVTRALRDLEVKGVLRRQRGLGTFVREPEDNAKGDLAQPLTFALFTAWAGVGQSVGSFHMQLLHGLSRIGADHHATIFLQTLSPRHGETHRDQVLAAAKALVARKPQVVLYCALELPHDEMGLNVEALEVFEDAGIDVAVVDRDILPYPERSKYPWISFDNRRGGMLVTQHMADQGYERVAFVSIEKDSTAVFERQSGYHDAVRAIGLPSDDELVIVSNDQPTEDDLDRILAARPDSIVCKDAYMAATIGMMLSRRGIEIGTQMGLAGFDDDPIAALLPVPLTVVRQPIDLFAAATFDVATMIASGDGPGTQLTSMGSRIVLPVELIPRESTVRR